VQNNSIFLDSIVNLTKINKKHSDKTDSSHESGKNEITWAWPTSFRITLYIKNKFHKTSLNDGVTTSYFKE
jgi:hypothetical protein